MATLLSLPCLSFLLLTHVNSDVFPLHFTPSAPSCPRLRLQTEQCLLWASHLSPFYFRLSRPPLALHKLLFPELRCSDWCVSSVSDQVLASSSSSTSGALLGQTFCPFHGNIFSGAFLFYQLFLLFLHHLKTCFWVTSLESFCLVWRWLIFVQVKYSQSIYLFLRGIYRE